MSSTTPFDYNYHYLKWHSEDESHYARLTRHYRQLLQPELVGLGVDAPILDVGCGMGFCVYALTHLGHTHVQGIDVSSEQLAAARRKGLPVALVEDTIDYLGRHRDRFELITAFDVIEHIPLEAQIEFARAIHGALKSGGRFVCTVPNANSVLAMRWRYIDWTHRCSFTEHSLDFVLHNAGFRDIKVSTTDQRPRWLLVPRRSVALWLLRSYFRFMRRLEIGAEVGFADARRMPLSVNLKGSGRKQ